MDPGQSSSLEEQIAALTARVYRLERAMSISGIAAPPAEAVHPAASPLTGQIPPAHEIPQPAAPYTLPQFLEPPPPQFPSSTYDFNHPPKTEQDHSLESRIGSQWFNRIGILAVLIAAAWFIKLAIDNHWIGPLGRVVIGLAAGAALIAWSERFQRSGYKLFAYSLKAIGSGVLYLSLWAAFSVFHLIPAGAAFAAMILVTAFNGFMAWLQDAELLALYAIVGGLSTPLLLSTGENHEVTLFSYVLLLDLAVLVLVALRPWSRLLVMAFAGTIFFYIGWYAQFYQTEERFTTAFFLSCFFLAFALAPHFARFARAEDENLPGWSAFTLVALPIGTAFFGFLAYYALIDPPSNGWAGAWLAVAFAAFYLLLLRIPSFGPARPGVAILSGLHLTAAVVFLTIAIPLKTHGRALTIGWLVEGAALLWLGSKINSKVLRVLSGICLVLGLGALLAVNPDASVTPIINQRFGTYFVAIAVFGFVAWLANRERREGEIEAKYSWGSVAAVASVVVNALILLAVGWEIHSFWWFRSWHGTPSAHRFRGFTGDVEYRRFEDYQMYAQFTYSAFFMLFGAILLAIGFWRRTAFLRWQALLLLAVTIGKVFLLDTNQLSQGYRILSFLGLGALLLAVSFVYQRDLLHLRNASPERQEP